MPSQKSVFLRWLDRQDLLPGALYFRDLLKSAAQSAFAQDGLTADQFADTALKRFWGYFIGKMEQDVSRAIHPMFEIVDASHHVVKWLPACACLSSDRKERATLGLLRARPHLLEAIDDLSNRAYEGLGCAAAVLAGASRYELTPESDDKGVDFYALIDMPSRCHLFGGVRGPLRIVGQSKQYGTPVGKKDVKGFLRVVEEVRMQAQEVCSDIPVWFKLAHGPIAGWLIADHGLQGGAAGLAQASGAVVADTLDIAELAATSRRLTRHIPPNQRATELAALVDKILQLPTGL